MAWTADDIPDQSGRVAVVTGANGGLGLETSRQLARKGAHVVMAARNLDKAATAEEDIRSEVANASLKVYPLDLGSLASIQGAAEQISAEHAQVDLLINNAGVMATPRLETADGFELQFGTNHLGHFALTAQLMPALLKGRAARVVTVTSTARHFAAELDPTDVHMEREYSPWRSYGRSKLANLHFAVELNRRLNDSRSAVTSLVAHPGYSNTDLQTQSARANPGGASQGFFYHVVRWVGMSAARGALSQLRAATDPAAKGGELYAPRWATNGPPERRPLLARSIKSEDLKLLWKVSERETGVEFDVAELVAESRR